MNGQIYVIGGRIGAGNIPATTNIDVVEEYDPATNLWGAIKTAMPTARSGGGAATYNGKIYVGRRRTAEPADVGGVPRARGVRSGDQHVGRCCRRCPARVHGNAMGFIGNKLHVVSGKMEGGGAPDMAAAPSIRMRPTRTTCWKFRLERSNRREVEK